MIYIQDLSLLHFLLACKLYNSGLQIRPLIWDHLRLMASVYIAGFYYWDIKKGQIEFFVTFLAVFFWSLTCTNQVYISQHILDMDNVSFERLQYLVFYSLVLLKILSLTTIYFSSNFSWCGNVTVLVCKLYMLGSVNYILFWTCPKFWTIFIFECFWWTMKVSYFSFC